MSWSNTFTGIVAISADIFTASVLWKHEDVTVSSLCGLELRKPGGIWSLHIIGNWLNGIQRNHCELAIASDIERAKGALKLLGGWPNMPQLAQEYINTLPAGRRNTSSIELSSFVSWLEENKAI